MKKKLFLSLFSAIAVITGAMQAADSSIILQSNDGKFFKIDRLLARHSEVLNDLLEHPQLAEKDDSGNLLFKSTMFDGSQLEKAHALLAFANAFPIDSLPENPIFDDHKKYTLQITQAALELIERYPDNSPVLFSIANFFSIPVATQVIAYLLIGPELDLQTLEKDIDENFDPLQLHMAEQLKKRISFAKANYFATDNPNDPYFKGVATQDLIDHNRMPQIDNNCLDLSAQNLTSLNGIENIQGLQNLQRLFLDNSTIQQKDELQKNINASRSDDQKLHIFYY